MKKLKPVKSAEQRKLDKLVKQYIPQNRTTLTARVVVQGQPGAGMKWQSK